MASFDAFAWATFLGKFKKFDGQNQFLLRDTYLMERGEKAKFIFKANNPGDWLFHCQMLEHHASGMGGIKTEV